MVHPNSPIKRIAWQNERTKKRMKKYRDAKKSNLREKVISTITSTASVTEKRNTPEQSSVTEKRNTPEQSSVTEKRNTPTESSDTKKRNKVCCGRELKDKGTADHVSRGNVSP